MTDLTTEPEVFDGGCTCRADRYRMMSRPLFVNCCHCRWCQRETGTAFALNAMIEAYRVQLLLGDPEVVDTPSNSGKGQKISRCPTCRVVSRRGATMPRRVMRCDLCALARLMSRIECRPTFRFSRQRSSPGCSCLLTCPQSPSITNCPSIGPRNRRRAVAR